MAMTPAVAIGGLGSRRGYTLQVASFPSEELADKFVAKLAQAGENTTRATVELPDVGYWTRVFVGTYLTAEAARRSGERV